MNMQKGDLILVEFDGIGWVPGRFNKYFANRVSVTMDSGLVINDAAPECVKPMTGQARRDKIVQDRYNEFANDEN